MASNASVMAMMRDISFFHETGFLTMLYRYFFGALNAHNERIIE